MTGEYTHQLDAKNRMRIPAKLKKELGDEYCFAKGENHCIYVFAKKDIDAKIELANQTKLSDLEKQKYLRAFMRTIVDAADDDQGRVVLIPTLRQHMSFLPNEREIVFIGVGNRAEIWARSQYDKYFADVDSDYNSVVANLDF